MWCTSLEVRHSLCCRFSVGRFPRHAEINKIFQRASAGIASVILGGWFDSKEIATKGLLTVSNIVPGVLNDISKVYQRLSIGKV